MITDDLGKRIRELRTHTGLSQEKFALKIGMPASWASSFGSDYYQQDPIHVSDQGWNVQEKGRPLPRNDPFKATGPQELKRQITSIVTEMKEGVTNGQ